METGSKATVLAAHEKRPLGLGAQSSRPCAGAVMTWPVRRCVGRVWDRLVRAEAHWWARPRQCSERQWTLTEQLLGAAVSLTQALHERCSCCRAEGLGSHTRPGSHGWPVVEPGYAAALWLWDPGRKQPSSAASSCRLSCWGRAASIGHHVWWVGGVWGAGWMWGKAGGSWARQPFSRVGGAGVTGAGRGSAGQSRPDVLSGTGERAGESAEKGPQWRGLREHERASTFSEVLWGQGDHQHLELSCGILGVVSYCSFD